MELLGFYVRPCKTNIGINLEKLGRARKQWETMSNIWMMILHLTYLGYMLKLKLSNKVDFFFAISKFSFWLYILIFHIYNVSSPVCVADSPWLILWKYYRWGSVYIYSSYIWHSSWNFSYVPKRINFSSVVILLLHSFQRQHFFQGIRVLWFLPQNIWENIIWFTIPLLLEIFFFWKIQGKGGISTMIFIYVIKSPYDFIIWGKNEVYYVNF